MKILVFGASGQLGHALCEEAPERGPERDEVIALTRAQCDLANTAAVEDAILSRAPDWVVNAAAYTAVDKAESEEALAHRINAEAVGAMVAALDRCGGRLAHVSTDFVFDGTSSRPYRPEDARQPLSAYGRSKAAGEDHLREADLLVRTSWVHAAGGRNFVRTMLGLMRERDAIAVVADQFGAPSYAGDLARTIWALIAAGARGAFHHCDAGVASWYDFAQAIGEEALGLGLIEHMPTIAPIASEDYPTAARRPRFSLLDCRKTRALLGDDPVHWRVNLRKMLKKECDLG